ncbi:MAG TPA: glycoside hydrolase family 30 protein [Clostridia bacterium]
MKDLTVICTAKNTEYKLSRICAALNNISDCNKTIKINTKKTYQRIIGFGGAFTTAGAMALGEIPETLREQALEAYFHPEQGIGYNLCRTHMGSCDFCTDIYSYSEYPDDIQLTRFSVEYDEKWIIPMIKKAKKIAGRNIMLYASPWSPPSWMKSNGSMVNGGRLLEKYYYSMAMYFVKYIEAYKKHGIDIWGITTQNEPDEIQKWPSCCYSAQEEKRLIKEFLVPLFKENGMEHINVLIWDSNKDKMYERCCAILEDKSLHEYIKGIAFHWYSGDFFDQLDLVHNKFPGMMLISSESCVAFMNGFNDWTIGERYGHEIIGDINHWTNGFIDWNMFLNEHGGPNMAGNYCAAPIHVDAKNGRLIFLNSYYYIGHFSRYFKQDALRVECLVSDADLEACAVTNPDGQVAAVIMNRTDSPACVMVDIDGDKYGIGLLPRSIITIIK